MAKEKGILQFTIPLNPVTKKNSSQIIYNKKTQKRKVIPSEAYKNYEKDASLFIPKANINEAVNIKAVFYMKTRRKVDLTNLNEALHDVLVRCGCIADDNCTIVASADGSRVKYDKENPRTEVTITRYEEAVFPD